MRIASKIIAFLLLGILVVQVLDGYLAVRRELELFDLSMRRDARVLGGALRAVLAETWRSSGERAARSLLARAGHGERQVRIRWVWLDPGETKEDRPRISFARLGAVRRGESRSLVGRIGSEGHLLTYLPLRTPSGRLGAVELAESLAPRNAYARETIIRKLWLLGSIALVCGLLIVPLGLVRLGRPLALLADKARRAGEGDLSGPVSIAGKDELAELARSMNRMCERLEEAGERIERETEGRINALEQLRHADRLKSMGRLAAGMAHELGTPLNVISARADLLADERLTPEEKLASARLIKEQVERMTHIVNQVLTFARKRAAARTSVDLSDVASASAALLQPEASRQGQRLRILRRPDSPVRVQADPDQLTQVLTTLLLNAMQSTPEDGEIQIHIEKETAAPPPHVTLPGGEMACIRVVDRGEGIAPEDLPHIFEPFFTTKDVGQGTGLGLSVAHGIVTEHGGWIAAVSTPGDGSAFSVYLPLEET